MGAVRVLRLCSVKLIALPLIGLAWVRRRELSWQLTGSGVESDGFLPAGFLQLSEPLGDDGGLRVWVQTPRRVLRAVKVKQDGSAVYEVARVPDGPPKEAKNGPQVHLAPLGALDCDSGESVQQDQCLTAVEDLAQQFEATMGRELLQVGTGGECGDTGWGDVPPGCSAQTAGDWGAHFKNASTGSGCVKKYQLVCTGPCPSGSACGAAGQGGVADEPAAREAPAADGAEGVAILADASDVPLDGSVDPTNSKRAAMQALHDSDVAARAEFLRSADAGTEFARGGGGTFDPATADLSSVQNLRVALFIQVGNHTLWKDFAQCIENVVGAQEYLAKKKFRLLDVYISFVDSLEGGDMVDLAPSAEKMQEYEASVRDLIGPNHSFYQVVENRGADIGQFLQQLAKAREMFPDLQDRYDLLLKVHTKTDNHWRGAVLEALCGSPSDVLQLLVRMMESDVVNIMGTAGLVSSYNLGASTEFIFRKKAAFPQGEVDAMERVWPIIAPGEKMIPVHDWLIIAGSCFWVKGSSLISQRLLDVTPQLLSGMPLGYKKGSCCQSSHALERLWPSMIQSKGGEVGIARWGKWKEAEVAKPTIEKDRDGKLKCRRRKRHGQWKWECTRPNSAHRYLSDKGK